MKPEIKARWVAALRSGEYKQGQKMLKNLDGSFCCLGVLCELHAKETGTEWELGDSGNPCYLEHTALVPQEVKEWAGLDYCAGGNVQIGLQRDYLPAQNDIGKTFEQIADAIEGQL